MSTNTHLAPRGHLERVRATRGEQGARAARLAFEPSVALLVELPVTANAAALDGLPHVIDLGPHEGRLVERNFHMVKYITKKPPKRGFFVGIY